ncbi:MAG: PLDc N-terminal domain-containing protein [Alistipes sp.]
MWAEIIYWLGVLVSVWCLYDLFTTKKSTELLMKVLVALIILFFSWIGFIAYWLFIRNQLK